MLKNRVKKLTAGLAESGVIGGMAAGLRNSVVPIMMLHRMQDARHGISGHDPAVLEQALHYVTENGYNPVSLADVVAALSEGAELPERAIAFTLDDGFYDQIAIAGPLFRRYRCPATIFLLGEFSSGQSWPWDYQIEFLINKTQLQSMELPLDSASRSFALTTTADRKLARNILREHFKGQHTTEALEAVQQLAAKLEVDLPAQPPEAYRPILWSEARENEDEWIQFGPHSMRHAILAAQTEADCRREIIESRDAIQRELSNPSSVFCYPTGRPGVDFGEREMQLVEEAGFAAALSVEPAYVDLKLHAASDRLYALPRFSLPETLEDFVQVCSWIEALKQKLRGVH